MYSRIVASPGQPIIRNDNAPRNFGPHNSASALHALGRASLHFQAICERYEKRQAIILTSNKAFADWGQVFADDPIMASAALDRRKHRSTVINIRGDSYRLKEKRQAKNSTNGIEVTQNM